MAQLISRQVDLKKAELIIVGGDTAYQICRSLGIFELEVVAIKATVAVRMQVMSGHYQGMQIWTKGGSVGPPTLLCDLLGKHAI